MPSRTPSHYITVIMINLYRPEGRSKSKTMFPVNKSHIASMNIRINCDPAPEAAR